MFHISRMGLFQQGGIVLQFFPVSIRTVQPQLAAGVQESFEITPAVQVLPVQPHGLQQPVQVKTVRCQQPFQSFHTMMAVREILIPDQQVSGVCVGYRQPGAVCDRDIIQAAGVIEQLGVPAAVSGNQRAGIQGPVVFKDFIEDIFEFIGSVICLDEPDRVLVRLFRQEILQGAGLPGTGNGFQQGCFQR